MRCSVEHLAQWLRCEGIRDFEHHRLRTVYSVQTRNRRCGGCLKVVDFAMLSSTTTQTGLMFFSLVSWLKDFEQDAQRRRQSQEAAGKGLF
eukprot:542767-Amphidinium_carterae.1